MSKSTLTRTSIQLSAIVAMAENRTIGKQNRLPWHLPADLRHFKKLTTGHPILMGRKTYESIGKPLPNRTNIILTRNPTYLAPGCEIVTTLDEAMQTAKHHHATEVFVIGGAEIYRQLLPQINHLYLTIVHEQIAGDAFFPLLDSTAWREVSRERHEADHENPHAYSFVELERV